MKTVETAPPPVPRNLREMLKGYPEHLRRLQAVLDGVVQKPLQGTPLYEQAIWALEGALEEFVSEARAELAAAEAGGETRAVEQAKVEKLLMGQARHRGMVGLHDLFDYFNTNREVSR